MVLLLAIIENCILKKNRLLNLVICFLKLCYENKKDIKTAVHVSINITSKKYTSSAIYVKKNCNNNIQINTIYTYISIFITQVNNYTK